MVRLDEVPRNDGGVDLDSSSSSSSQRQQQQQQPPLDHDDGEGGGDPITTSQHGAAGAGKRSRGERVSSLDYKPPKDQIISPVYGNEKKHGGFGAGAGGGVGGYGPGPRADGMPPPRHATTAGARSQPTNKQQPADYASSGAYGDLLANAESAVLNEEILRSLSSKSHDEILRTFQENPELAEQFAHQLGYPGSPAQSAKAKKSGQREEILKNQGFPFGQWSIILLIVLYGAYEIRKFMQKETQRTAKKLQSVRGGGHQKAKGKKQKGGGERSVDMGKVAAQIEGNTKSADKKGNKKKQRKAQPQKAKPKPQPQSVEIAKSKSDDGGKSESEGSDSKLPVSEVEPVSDVDEPPMPTPEPEVVPVSKEIPEPNTVTSKEEKSVSDAEKHESNNVQPAAPVEAAQTPPVEDKAPDAAPPVTESKKSKKKKKEKAAKAAAAAAAAEAKAAVQAAAEPAPEPEPEPVVEPEPPKQPEPEVEAPSAKEHDANNENGIATMPYNGVVTPEPVVQVDDAGFIQKKSKKKKKKNAAREEKPSEPRSVTPTAPEAVEEVKNEAVDDKPEVKPDIPEETANTESANTESPPETTPEADVDNLQQPEADEVAPEAEENEESAPAAEEQHTTESDEALALRLQAEENGELPPAFDEWAPVTSKKTKRSAAKAAQETAAS